jgi:hypothetical protein
VEVEKILWNPLLASWGLFTAVLEISYAKVDARISKHSWWGLFKIMKYPLLTARQSRPRIA